MESPGVYVPKSKPPKPITPKEDPKKTNNPEPTPELVAMPSTLLMGSYDLAEVDPVIDGDSFRIPQLEGDIRLVGVDCEEVFKEEAAKTIAEKDFVSYATMMQGKNPLPGSYATPLGEESKEYAQVFFQFGGKVRLEYDSLKHPTDFYGRHLVHLFYESYGQQVHYNVELVKRGYSAYVTKFGRSERYDKELREAQEEAKKNKLGIWDPKKKHYPDYTERFKWWNARADAITQFESDHRKDPNYVRLDDADAMDRLRKLNGKVAVVFGSVYGVRDDKKPNKLLMAHKDKEDFSLISFQPERFASITPRQYLGSYIYVQGTIELYHNQPQMRLEDGAAILKK
jgi:endonuclease YncB( thermonuclease family)